MRNGHIAAYAAVPLVVAAVVVVVSLVGHVTPSTVPAAVASSSVDGSSVPADVVSTGTSDAPSASPTVGPSPSAVSSRRATTPRATPTPTKPVVTGPAILTVTASSAAIDVDQQIENAITVCVPTHLTITNDGGGEITQVTVDPTIQAQFPSSPSAVTLAEYGPLPAVSVSVTAGHPQTRDLKLCGTWDAGGVGVYIEWKARVYVIGGLVSATVTGAPPVPQTRLSVNTTA